MADSDWEFKTAKGSSYRLPTWPSSLPPAASSLVPAASALVPAASARLLEIARPAREKKKLISSLSKAIIRQLCSGQYLTADEIGALMDRGNDKLQKNFLSEMVDSGELKLRFPNQPTHPDQAHTAIPRMSFGEQKIQPLFCVSVVGTNITSTVLFLKASVCATDASKRNTV